MKKKKTDKISILFILIPLTAVILYIIRLISCVENSDGRIYISYNSNYPLILLGEYAAVSLLILFCAKKIGKDKELNTYIIPLLLFTALGMMRIDSDTPITSTTADHNPAIMFIILLSALLIMAFSGHSVTGAIGTIAGTAVSPAFGLCFSPFITAAAFLINKEKKKEQLISVILNGILSLGAFIYGAVKLDITEIVFTAKHIPVILLVLVWAVFCIIVKNYRLLPLSALPLFPLTAGLAFGTFPTPVFTLSACIAPFVILLGIAAVKGENEKIRDYAKYLSATPALYIIITVFILHTTNVMFMLPGFFRNVYT